MTHPTVTPELVEQVARALCEQSIIADYIDPSRVEELQPFRAVEVDCLWERHVPQARAALAQAAPIIAAQARAEALEEAARLIEGLKTCGCNGSHGRCLEDDPYDAAAEAIRNLAKTEEG